MRSLAETNTTGNFGEPDAWEFTHEWSFIQTAFWLWAMSDFTRMPNQEEVKAFDPEYLSDMKLAYNIYSHQKNTNPVMYLLEQYESFQQNPDAVRQQNNLLKAQWEHEKNTPKTGVRSPYPEAFGDHTEEIRD